jgi:hypothetical protein
MPKMPGGDEKKEESAESKEEAAEQVIRIRQPGGGYRTGSGSLIKLLSIV